MAGGQATIVEQPNCLGGVATSGAHNHFSLFTAWGQFDVRIVGGIAAPYSACCLGFCVEGLKLLLDDPAGPGMSGQTWRPERGFRYRIPYRAMVPERVDNLLVAGRCISADHVALGSTRIMSTCMALGAAAGTAAMMSLHEEARPRELGTAPLRGQLRKQGAVVDEAGIEALNR